MENEQNDEVIVGDEEANNETVEENTEAEPAKAEKPERTPKDKYEYHMSLAKRYAKQAGVQSEPEVKTNSSKPNELSDGQIAILRTEGIKSRAEIALFKEVMQETGKGVLDLLDSSYFQSRLSDFRTAQESANAIPKGKNRSAQTGVTDTDVAFAKFKETGELPADFKTRSEVVNRAIESEKSSNMFSGPAVIGPKGQSY